MFKRKKQRTILHPIMAFLILTIGTVVLSGILGALGVSANYNSVNTIRGDLNTTTVLVTSLFNLSGLKQIFRTTVSNFASFAPLINIIIVLIGVGIMDKSGFLESFFTLLTKKASKFKVTFVLTIITILASITGDLSFVVLLPICARCFKYGKRNPKAGIIMAFAGLTCGMGINICMSSIDAALMEYTRAAALSLDTTYMISNYAYLFIMIFMTIISAIVITNITEKIIVPKMGKYEVDEEQEEFYLDKKKKKGLALSLTVGLIYILIFVYNIIPGLPFSGNLLDYSQTLYIDKLFGYNSFFNQGFVFVVTLFFFLCGLFYGIGAGTIKNNQEMSTYLGHSLDGIGKPLVILFFASTFIAIFKATNIGNVIVALIGDGISAVNFTGIPLIIIAFLGAAISTLFLPSPVTCWSIMSGVLVPVFMNAGMTAEFAQLVFRAGECVTYGLTPIMAYFAIYLAVLDKNTDSNKPTSLIESIKDILPFSGIMALVWITVLIVLYIIGIPFGIGTSAIL